MEYGLIGEKLGHSASKEIHEQLADYSYELHPLAKEEFPVFMEEKAFRALNVTIPYKQAVIPYLTLSAAKGLDKSEEKKEGHYIRKERYEGACQRSFYVGPDVTEEDIKAEFKHGILKLFVPKKEHKDAVEQKKYIAIEG